MAKRNNHKEQQALLGELESIKNLLDDNAFDDIPLLEEMVLDDDPMPVVTESSDETQLEPSIPTEEPTENTGDIATEALAPGVLPGQQSLFNDKSVASPVKPAASSENPFLPQHIRERLKGNNPGITMPELPSKPIILAPTVSTIGNQQQQVVDALVQEYMPKIEAELRRRLEEKLKQS